MLRVGLGVGLTTMVALAPVVAQAYSCVAGPDVVLPLPESTDVPVDARIWVTEHEEGRPLDTLRLVRTDDGLEIAVELQTLQTEHHTIVGSFRPIDALESNTSYALLAEGDEVVTSFVTGNTTHDAAPAVPKLLHLEAHSTRSHEWGYEEWFLVDFDLQHEGMLVVMDREQTATIKAQPDGKVTDLSANSSMMLGTGGCVWNYREAGENVETTVRFGTFDLAGNFSGWTEPMGVTFDALPEEPSSASCRIAGRSSSTLSIAFLLLAAVARRRKARESPASPCGR
jgi:hypothetical protein